jgi:transcriptional regulator with XRE-family HTH domain
MNIIKELREKKGISQRQFAELAGISFGTIQLTESGKHDPKISTLEKISVALGYEPNDLSESVSKFFENAPESIAVVSQNISKKNWQEKLFEFVDEFRRAKNKILISAPPASNAPKNFRALLASTVETLCEELEMEPPGWAEETLALEEPWFVAEIENLKASALQESPVHFRKRNIFVLENFLSRA